MSSSSSGPMKEANVVSSPGKAKPTNLTNLSMRSCQSDNGDTSRGMMSVPPLRNPHPSLSSLFPLSSVANPEQGELVPSFYTGGGGTDGERPGGKRLEVDKEIDDNTDEKDVGWPVKTNEDEATNKQLVECSL